MLTTYYTHKRDSDCVGTQGYMNLYIDEGTFSLCPWHLLKNFRLRYILAGASLRSAPTRNLFINAAQQIVKKQHLYHNFVCLSVFACLPQEASRCSAPYRHLNIRFKGAFVVNGTHFRVLRACGARERASVHHVFIWGPRQFRWGITHPHTPTHGQKNPHKMIFIYRMISN